MGIMPYREYKIAANILSGSEEYYAFSTKDIKGINICGVSGNYRFTSYSMDEELDEVIIAQVKHDDRYYFKPLFSDDYILIISEDYNYGDSDDLSLGETKTSNNRFDAYRKHSIREFENDLTLEENRELVLNNPLGVYLTSVVPLSSIGDKGKRMIDYNIKYAKDLKHKLSRMRIKASDKIEDGFRRIDNTSKKYTR